MIAGYITYNELKLITGYSDQLLKNLILQGLNIHELEVAVEASQKDQKINEQVFNLKEIENWLKVHIY